MPCPLGIRFIFFDEKKLIVSLDFRRLVRNQVSVGQFAALFRMRGEWQMSGWLARQLRSVWVFGLFWVVTWLSTSGVVVLAVDVNQFEVPKDRDETLFLVNWVEHIGWDLWPGEQASLAELQGWASLWHPQVAMFQERARVAGLHPELQNMLNHLRAFIEANQQYCTTAPKVPGMIDAQVQERNIKLQQEMVEGVATLVLEKFFGTAESERNAKSDVANQVVRRAGEALQFKLEAGQTAASWNAAQRRDLATMHRDHEADARLSVATMRVTRNWASGETRFDGSARASTESILAHRLRDPFSVHPVLSARARSQTPFAAMSDAVALYERARYVPDESLYKPYQLFYLGAAAQLATDAAAQDQKRYSDAPRIPARMAMKLWERFLDKTSKNDRPTVHQTMHLARAHALNGSYQSAVKIMAICANKPEFERDMSFHFRYALMLSLADKPAESLRHLQIAKTLGLTDLNSLESDPDLKTVREKLPDQFAAFLHGGS